MLALPWRAARQRCQIFSSVRSLVVSAPIVGFHTSSSLQGKRTTPRAGFTVSDRSSTLKISRAKIRPNLKLATAPSERDKRVRERLSLMRERYSEGLSKLVEPVLDPSLPYQERRLAMFKATAFWTNSIPRVAKLSDPILWNQMFPPMIAVGTRRHPKKFLAVMKRNGISPDMHTFTSVFRALRQELLRRRREATPSMRPEHYRPSSRQEWEIGLVSRKPEHQIWLPASLISQHQDFIAPLEQFRIAALDFYRMQRGETLASTGGPSPVFYPSQRRNTGKHSAALKAPEHQPQYTPTHDPKDEMYAKAASLASHRSHLLSRRHSESGADHWRMLDVETPQHSQEELIFDPEDSNMISSPVDDGQLTALQEAENAVGPSTVDPEFEEHAEDIARAHLMLERDQSRSSERLSASSVQALVQQQHQELDEQSRGNLTPWQRMYLTKRKALLKAADNWDELATAYALAIGLGAMLGRPNQAWGLYSNISLPGARRGLPWPHGLIFYTVLRHLTPAPNEARDLAKSEQEALKLRNATEGIQPDEMASKFDPYLALGPTKLDTSTTALDATRVPLEVLAGGADAGLTPTGRPLEGDSCDGKEMLLQWRPKLRTVIDDWLIVLCKTARTRDPPQKFLDAVWMDAFGLNQVVHTLTLMDDEKSATLALRLVAGMFKIYDCLPVPLKPQLVHSHKQKQNTQGTWEALQAAGLGDAPPPELDEEERSSLEDGREKPEDNPWLTPTDIEERRKSTFLAEESDFPDEIDRDQDAAKSIFSMASGIEEKEETSQAQTSASESQQQHKDQRTSSNSGTKEGRRHKKFGRNGHPRAQSENVREEQGLERTQEGPLFAEKGDALSVYTRRRELRFELRRSINNAMTHQLHTNIMICCHRVGRPELYSWIVKHMGVPRPETPELDMGRQTADMSARKRRQVAAKLHKYPFGRPPTILPFDMRASPFGRTRHLRLPLPSRQPHERRFLKSRHWKQLDDG